MDIAVPVSIIPTGPVNPGLKRDMGLKHAKGQIIAFLDDDTYPCRDWLKNAVRNFDNPDVAAVGGPAVTPDKDSFMQRASGLVYSSIVVSGSYKYRYVPGKKQEVDDFPSCNLFVRKQVLLELGGFNTAFWPGEDTKLCLDIIKSGRKIVYDPEVLVWHHRRPLFIPHLRQIASYALHRGYFVKRFPENSLKPAYFLPSILTLGLAIGAIISIFSIHFRFLFLSGAALYALIVLAFSIKKQVLMSPCVFFGVIATHLTYGAFFLKGLLAKKLKEEN